MKAFAGEIATLVLMLALAHAVRIGAVGTSVIPSIEIRRMAVAIPPSAVVGGGAVRGRYVVIGVVGGELVSTGLPRLSPAVPEYPEMEST